MSDSPAILHETGRRLRVALPRDVEPNELPKDLCRIEGVSTARVSIRTSCVAVEYDGRPEVRAAVLQRLSRGHASPGKAIPRYAQPGTRGAKRSNAAHALIAKAPQWTPTMLALAAPLAAGRLRSGFALSSIALRALQRRDELLRDPAAVILDSTSLATLALSGQVPVVATAVLLKQIAEKLSERMVSQADDLLSHLLPTEAGRYKAIREPAEHESWWPLSELRAGDRIRLLPGDVVPLDGCITEGTATLEPVLPGSEARSLTKGASVAAGERLALGSLVMRAEVDAEHSRLARLRAQLRHVIAARDPAGPLAGENSRLVSLPLTAAALVFGFTKDAARAAAMLQADPQQGLDLAQPVTREAALLALARAGLVASGLESLVRLAKARALVLQDTGVLACGRWTLDVVDVERGGDAALVRRWIARLAGSVADEAYSLPDRLIRVWQRHGALLRTGGREVHLATPARLRAVWGLELPAVWQRHRESAQTSLGACRDFGLVADGRIVARVVLSSAWRHGVAENLVSLRRAGFERIALVAEDASNAEALQAPPADFEHDEWLSGGIAELGDWLAVETHDGRPAVIVHTVLRDVVPPGSLALAPLDAEAGSHGVLAGDPLATLVAARLLAQQIERRLRRQHGFALATNAALMTAGAVRWLPPMAVTLMHHGAGLLLLLDSLRIESLKVANAAPAVQRGHREAPFAASSQATSSAQTSADGASLLSVNQASE